MKKMCFFQLTIVCTAICLLTSPGFAKYSGGDGTQATPYRIATPADLNDIGNHTEDFASHFIMVDDIDLSVYTGTQFNIIGNETTPFIGVFDGNNHTISNFTYDSSTTNLVGIFGIIGITYGMNGEIKDLGLIASDVDAGTGEKIGTLVGYSSRGIISNCYVVGNIKGGKSVGGLVGDGFLTWLSNCYAVANIAGEDFVGGLIGGTYSGGIIDCYSASIVETDGNSIGGLLGYTIQGSVSNCYSTGYVEGNNIVGGLAGKGCNIEKSFSTCTVLGIGSSVGGLAGDNLFANQCFASGNITGSNYVGGLIGTNGGEISDSYASGDISGTTVVGGLAGSNTDSSGLGTISNCYSSGTISGTTDIGGVVGNDDNGTYTKCFWGVTVNAELQGIGNGSDPNVIGKSTVEMKQMATFTDWDFVNVWGIGENQTYPYLKTEPAGELNHIPPVDILDFAIFAGNWLKE